MSPKPSLLKFMVSFLAWVGGCLPRGACGRHPSAFRGLAKGWNLLCVYDTVCQGCSV